jgi:transposase
MRVSVSKSKNSISLYVIKSTFTNGVGSSKVIENLGTIDELKKKLGDKDPYEWAKERAAELTRLEKEQTREIIIKYSPVKRIQKEEQRLFNVGYLFLQQIYYELGIHKLCRQISEKYKFKYNLDSILSRLVYGRIIFPASKLATTNLSKKFIEQPDFKIHQALRSLEHISKEMDYMQAELYKNSKKIIKRNTNVLYYDLTNYFFEIEQEDGLRKYGCGKQNKPNPLVGMGLFMDGDGIPLAFCIHSGNTNEQITLKPLEKKILSDFELSRFVVCTDAGLSSTANRKYNNIGGRAFVTTQSIKKLLEHLREWSLDPTGWRLPENDPVRLKKKDGDKYYDIREINEEEYEESIFFKERWINEHELEQRMIVTFSIKYRNYQEKIRDSQIERAKKLIKTKPANLKKAKQNDFKRLIATKNVTEDGEVAKKVIYNINNEIIEYEKRFDGFYAVCTNLEDKPSAIVKINQRRWEIEESFRIMKNEFKARPVYLSLDERIEAHFMTCFLALLIYRLLEKRLEEKFTCCQIIYGLREMNLLQAKGEGYIPVYTRTDFTDALHDAYGFRTDYEIVTDANMKKILKSTKRP